METFIPHYSVLIEMNTENKYGNLFDPSRIVKYIMKYAKSSAVKLLYASLLLVYAYKRSDTPSWAKNIIIGSIGYLLSPIDSIPDLTPFLGFTDDFGVLLFGIVTIACYINHDVRDNAVKQLRLWFKDVDEGQLEEVNAVL